jgi:hypothetical protein
MSKRTDVIKAVYCNVSVMRVMRMPFCACMHLCRSMSVSAPPPA